MGDDRISVTAGQLLELELHGFARDGQAVGRPCDGGPAIFVRGGLPGQRVRAEITAVKNRWAEAESRELLRPVSSDFPVSGGGQRPAPCPHAGQCGGCPWQELPLVSQLFWKREAVADALTRIGGLDRDTVAERLRPVLPSPGAEWGYRNKMEFAFVPGEKGQVRLGLRRRASHDVVEVTGCLLQTDRTMNILTGLRTAINQSGLAAWDSHAAQSAALRFAVIRETRDRSCVVEIITSAGDRAAFGKVRAVGEKLLGGSWGVSGFVHSVRSSLTNVACGEKTALSLGKASLCESLALAGHPEPVRFHLGHQSFFQVNTAAAELLYNTAAALAQSFSPNPQDRPSADAAPCHKTCWDVYCGVGGLALALAPYFGRVLGLEGSAAAVALARRNAAGLAHCRFECSDAARLGEYMRRFGPPDVLCADPPRAGLAPAVIRAILRSPSPRLLLVSCDPATLARDMGLLSSVYELRVLQPVDLFPQTPHVESVAVLDRRD